jgi:two-component system, NtrC family, sensor kinase
MQTKFSKFYRFLLLIICFLFYVACSESGKVSSKAVSGVLDLREWNFETDGNVNLDGEWEFYWGEVLDLNQIAERKACFESIDKVCRDNYPTDEISYYVAPSNWKGYEYKVKNNTNVSYITIGSKGYATYHLKIKNLEKGNFIFKIPYMATAYELFIDNIFIHGGKKFSTKEEDQIIEKKIELIYFNNHKEEIDLVLHISNFNHIQGGLWDTIQIGRPNNILSKFHQTIARSFTVFGILFIMGIYHLGLFISRKKDPSALYFSIFCLLISVRHYFYDIYYGYTFTPKVDFSTGMKIEYSTLYLLPLFILLFINNIFKNKYQLISKILYIIILSTFILGIFSSTYYITSYLNFYKYIYIVIIIYILFIIIISIKNKVIGANIFLIGTMIFSLTIINDILSFFNVIKSAEIMSYGFLFFIFSQSYILSIRFSKAFEEVETLSTTLKISNEQLELTKERATKAYLDLEASQKQLVQSDKMITLGTMVAGVAHEINTPLGAIKANSENILESLRGLIQKLNPTLSHITISDLQNAIFILELSKDPKTAISSREARVVRKKVISALEEKGKINVEVMADYFLDMGLVEALERGEEILNHPELEKYLSIANDLHGIRKKSSVVLNSAERVSKIVKSLKSFMHFDQNEKMIVSDLSEGMETVLIILHNKIKYGIEVIKNYGENVPQILCFPDELNQVWTNLIHNAIQAMEEKGTLQIDIESITNLEGKPDIDKRNSDYKGGYVSVSIQDSGSGISPELRTKIFQAFFTTKSAGEGSGLGLHIIGKILEKHAGALYLESEVGKTRFTVILPMGIHS